MLGIVYFVCLKDAFILPGIGCVESGGHTTKNSLSYAIFTLKNADESAIALDCTGIGDISSQLTFSMDKYVFGEQREKPNSME